MSDSHIKYEVGHKVRLKPEITESKLTEIGIGSKEFRDKLLKGEVAAVNSERNQAEGSSHGGILCLKLNGVEDPWEVYVDMVIPVTPYFRRGDPVRVHATVEQLESINIEEEYAQELVDGLVGEFTRYTPDDSEGLVYGAIFKHEDDITKDWGFENGMLQPVAFRPGDRVRCVATPEQLETKCIGKSAHEDILGKVGVVNSSEGRTTNAAFGQFSRLWFKTEWLVLAVEDEADVELVEDEAEPEWDPMEEPLQVGDHVELIRPRKARTGTTGVVRRIYDQDGKTFHSLKYDADGYVDDGGWIRDGLKLLKKGDGTAPKAARKDEPPPPKVAVGDKVKITHTTKELQAIGYSVIQAARRAGKTGVVRQVDDSAPHVLVHVEAIGETAWCNFEGVEKVAA